MNDDTIPSTVQTGNLLRSHQKLWNSKLHPDTSGKQGHTDFVKLNEAYKILGKESTRRQYDFELKYNRYNPSYTHNSQNTQYGSQWEYEVRAAGGPWPPPPNKPNALFGLLIALACIGLGLLQAIFFLYSMNVRKRVILRNAKIENEYQQIRDSARNPDDQFFVKDFNSVEDFNEYLIKDDSEC
ncbi:PREDICTED: dnaJ homolog subfamily C member 4-like isoform X2 [Wasmannia auropunctata]|uniref:dnaJ homolog subfamily C member 4-like isoform X2 n=1 Tax=Wasmannia auropunctata TaxID=64793 RepID=UPI0005F03D5F|nr:PREDICTED: dnaJ homolog subfamily C member 4-like isoform X2 [Wasmannia auropunctata]